MTVSKSTIKYIKSLGRKKFRQKYNNFVVEGDKMVRELLQQQPQRVEALYAQQTWLAALPPLPIAQHRIHLITETELRQLSFLTTPNQVLAVVMRDEPPDSAAALRVGWPLYLDGIQDPGNFGTILRIADWFGVPAVFCAKNCVDPYHPKAVQASMGAFLRVHVIEQELEALCRLTPGLPVLGAAMDGENVFESDLPARGLIVIGNEGNGISAEASRWLTGRIAIPAAAHAGAESLNAAVATGIICAVVQHKLGRQPGER
jgi:TrmH family RNA methyltransferase